MDISKVEENSAAARQASAELKARIDKAYLAVEKARAERTLKATETSEKPPRGAIAAKDAPKATKPTKNAKN